MTGAAELFRKVFRTEPAGVFVAPGRVNLIGEHTDYNQGLVLPFAITEHAQVAMAPRTDRHLRLFSAQQPTGIIELSPGDKGVGPSGWSAYAASVPWALHVDIGFDITIDSSVPIGSGLASSAALVCAVALAINDLVGLGLTRPELARRSQRAENEYVGAPTGNMDQIAAFLCTREHALLYDSLDKSVQQVPFDPDAADLQILVLNTSSKHNHADGAYAERRRECELATRLLGVGSLRELSPDSLESEQFELEDHLARRVKHVVTENHRVREVIAALAREDWANVGTLLTAGHLSIRDDFEASSPEQDLAVAVLIESGALGARMTGGGFGGAVLSLVRTEDVEPAISDLASAFQDRGFATPANFTVSPSDGAHRIA